MHQHRIGIKPAQNSAFRRAQLTGRVDDLAGHSKIAPRPLRHGTGFSRQTIEHLRVLHANFH